MENVIYLSQLSHLCGAQFRFTEAILALKRIFQHQNRMFLPFMPFSLVDAQKSAFFLVHMRLPCKEQLEFLTLTGDYASIHLRLRANSILKFKVAF